MAEVVGPSFCFAPGTSMKGGKRSRNGGSPSHGPSSRLQVRADLCRDPHGLHGVAGVVVRVHVSGQVGGQDGAAHDHLHLRALPPQALDGLLHAGDGRRHQGAQAHDADAVPLDLRDDPRTARRRAPLVRSGARTQTARFNRRRPAHRQFFLRPRKIHGSRFEKLPRLTCPGIRALP